MPGFFIDIESQAGSKYGAGPISTASRWQHVRRMDRAGAISFTMPATDEHASLLANRRYARCRSQMVGSWSEFGQGIIDSIAINTEQMQLTVSGDDLLRELAMRPIGVRQFYAGTDPMPLTDALDLILTTCNAQPGPDWTIDAATYASTGSTTNTSTTISSVTNIQNWQGREGTPIFGAGIPSGATVTAVGTNTLTISAAATANASGVALGRYPVYYTSGDESILAILNKMAELTGTHFRLGTGRQIVWLFNVTPSSGLRAVKDVDPVAAASNPAICLITGLEYIQDSTALISQITPWGSGTSDTRLRLAETAADPNKTTRTAPDGYTLDLDSNTIRRDDAETDYGYFNKQQSFNDVSVGLDSDQPGYAAALVAARNQLFDAALEYLRSHSYLQESFRLSVVKLDAEVLPGQTIRVEYRGVGTVTNPYTGQTSTSRWIDINRDLLILEVTTEFDENGVRTPGLVVAAVDRWPSNDVELLLGLLRQVQQAQSHDQPVHHAATAGTVTDDSVTTVKLTDNSVTTAKIVDGNVTPAKLSSAVYPLARVTTPATVVNVATEQTPITISIPGGTLGTDRRIRIRIVGTLLNNSGANTTCRVRLFYGATQIFNDPGVTLATSASARGFIMDVELAGRGATNAQVCSGWAGQGPAGSDAGNPNGTTTFRMATHGTIAEDSTVSKNLEIRVLLGNAAATISLTIHRVDVELAK